MCYFDLLLSLQSPVSCALPPLLPAVQGFGKVVIKEESEGCDGDGENEV